MTLQTTSTPAGSTTRRGLSLSAFGLVTAAGVAAALALAAVDPNEPGHYPTCPFLATTGLYCPGCGSLRAGHALLHGDLMEALARNPFAVAMAPLLALAWVLWGLRLLGRRAPHPTQVSAVWVWALLGVILLYGVLRNLPGWTFLSPA